ncbi:Ornithine carbamoyltransferase [Spironucleus salmonicida]|uniref:ornithine carbamoyltransferase n=1 Tax=Spironucleus salmonicida TaxID=348837 RepID=V6LV86_9EUKA|nr:Ornithine carbamoyltransferase [Spironucleus salmonicida]|eukprot:EST44694.1 Ornithine carbamoyltransferase [Spironucleus salmonicida]
MPYKNTRHLLTISSLAPAEFERLIDTAIDMKINPEKYQKSCSGKQLLAFFAKPSLRTRISLETAMTNLGGHCIYYELGANSNLGVKETMQDTAEVISRMVDVVSARLPTRASMTELAKFASVPCINALDDWAHPLQMVCDFMTIKMHFGSFKGLRMCYSGDCYNNVTYDIMRACAMLGMEMVVICPDHKDYSPVQEVIDEVATLNRISGGKCTIAHDIKACAGVNIMYADSWMSYHISKDQKAERYKHLMPFQINDEAMALTATNSVFMNCLPAQRGDEQTASVMDGPKSIAYTEAGNRLWSAMAVLNFFINDVVSK